MLNDTERATFNRIANQLIPASHGMPAFSASGADPVCLDRVLMLRPELLDPLRAALAAAAGVTDAGVLNRDNPGAIGIIGLAAASAYYLEPGIRERLGYPGQTHRPATEDEEGDYAGLLQPVIDRGPIYRKV